MEEIVQLPEGADPQDKKNLAVLKWTMLLHDTGKPAARSTDEAGIDHFYGHGEISAH